MVESKSLPNTVGSSVKHYSINQPSLPFGKELILNFDFLLYPEHRDKRDGEKNAEGQSNTNNSSLFPRSIHRQTQSSEKGQSSIKGEFLLEQTSSLKECGR